MPSGRGQTPFVGRQRELAVLLEHLETARQGQGGVVLVAGEPGIGKTRLLGELARRARAEGWLVLAGRAYDTEGMPPYLPFAEALRDCVRTTPIQDLEGQLAASGPEVALIAPAIRGRLPELAQPASQGLEQDRYRLFERVTDFLLALANGSEGPGLLLLLDDLQWADASTLLLVRHLARRLSNAPLLLAGAYRSIELPPRHPLSALLAELRRDGPAERLHLRPLPTAALGALVQSLSGLRPAEEVVNAIEQRTEGNPFFVGEVVRHLRLEGLDLTDRRVADAAWGVPEGVRAVVGQRLARLSPQANRLLQLSAVLGDGFTFEELQEAAAEDAVDLLDAIDEGISAGMLRETDDAYECGHALIRQTVYDSMLLARRQRLHLQVAEALERLHARNLAPYLSLLAAHFRLAGAATDAEKAITYAIRSGEQAQTVFAWEETVSHWQATVEVMEESGADPERRADLLVRLGDLIFVTEFRSQLGRNCFEAALALYTELGQVEQAAEVHARLGRYLAQHTGSQDLPAARAHFQAARPMLERETTPGQGLETATLGSLYIGIAYASLYALHLEPDAPQLLERALAIGERLGDIDLQGQALAVQVLWHTHACRFGEAFALAERSWELAVGRCTLLTSGLLLAHPYFLCRGLWDPRSALGWLARLLDLPAAANARSLRAQYQAMAAYTHCLLGEPEAADQAAEQTGDRAGSEALRYLRGDWPAMRAVAAASVDASRHRGDRLNQSTALWRGAEFARLEGDLAAAEAASRAALALLPPESEYFYPVHELNYRSPLVLLLAETGRPAEARSELERCRAMVSNGEDWRGLLGSVERAEAAVLAAERNLMAAAPYFERALATFERYGLVWEEAETQIFWGRFLLQTGGRARERAGEYFEAAIAIYERIGAGQPWLERVQREQARVASGPPRISQPSVLSPRYPDGLSEREVEVLRLVAAGKSNQAIADCLIISLSTVLSHVSHIFAKTGAANRAQATSYAHRHGLLP